MEVKDIDLIAFLLARGWKEESYETRLEENGWKETWFTFPKEVLPEVEWWNEATNGYFSQCRKRVMSIVKAVR